MLNTSFLKFCKLITKYDIAVKLAIQNNNNKHTNIVCYYNLANKQGITMVLPVAIKKIDKTSRQLTPGYQCV